MIATMSWVLEKYRCGRGRSMGVVSSYNEYVPRETCERGH